MKTLKCIDYQQGKILVDENNQYSKLGDLVVSLNGDTYKSTVGERALQKNEYVVIAQHNLNLEGIPFIELEDDVEKLMYDAIQKARGNDFKTFYELAAKNCSEVYKAQPKKYTEDDLRKAIRMMQKKVKAEGKFGEPWERYPTEEEVVQSLQPKIESVEIETKTVFDGDDEHDEGGTLPSVVESYEQPITYQKDGKTYLKVNKINYEA